MAMSDGHVHAGLPYRWPCRMAMLLAFLQTSKIAHLVSSILAHPHRHEIVSETLRIAAPEEWGMALTQKLRMCIAPELRIARYVEINPGIPK